MKTNDAGPLEQAASCRNVPEHHASASGLDPHISPENAELQLARVAKARSLIPEEIRQLIRQHTAAPDLGFLGDPGVNILTLNLALDAIGPAPVEKPITPAP